MSNIKNKQHYVFQAYLKNWCNDNDKLWVYSKKERKIFSSGTNNILHKRRFYQLRNLNEDERKFLEFLMECLKVNKTTKAELWRHVELYLAPYKFKHIVDMTKRLNPVPVNHPLNQELQLGFANLYQILEEGIVNVGEDVYSDFEASGMEYIRRIIEGDLQFYYPSIDNCSDVALQNSRIYEKRDEFIVFLFIQYFRTVRMRKVCQKNIHDMIDVIKNNEIKYEKKIVNFLLDNIDEKNLVPHLSMLFLSLCTDAFINNNAHLTVLKNFTTENFLTSDQPIINLKSKDNGSMPDEFVLYYPLSPKIAIKVNDNNDVVNEITIIDKEVVRKYNDKLINEAYDYIVSSNEEQLRLGYVNNPVVDPSVTLWPDL